MNQNSFPTGSWTHSFEEDESGGVLVYRPTHSFAFPPTRAGRDMLVFGASGEISQLEPGPDDRPRPGSAHWKALGMNRFAPDSGPGPTIEVVQAQPDLLKIRKL